LSDLIRLGFSLHLLEVDEFRDIWSNLLRFTV